MFDLLLSDPVIFLGSVAGLVVTTVSIVRDTRRERAQRTVEPMVAAEEYAEAA